jgi:hypothetical protein
MMNAEIRLKQNNIERVICTMPPRTETLPR